MRLSQLSVPIGTITDITMFIGNDSDIVNGSLRDCNAFFFRDNYDQQVKNLVIALWAKLGLGNQATVI